APRLGGRAGSEPGDLDAKRGGKPVIAVDAHVRLASASFNDGERILRRGYSFTDGVDESLGELEAGLFFICFQRDPAKQFVAIQRRLGSIDALNEYIKHVGSALFAVPPRAKPSGYVGEGLLAGGVVAFRPLMKAESRPPISQLAPRFFVRVPNLPSQNPKRSPPPK